MPDEAWLLLAFLAWMEAWWLSEVPPLAATALLPVVVMPLVGIAPIGTVTQSWGHPLVFLFVGGFMLARAIEAAGLHHRMALVIATALLVFAIPLNQQMTAFALDWDTAKRLP